MSGEPDFRLDFPAELPISAAGPRIIEALAGSSVVIVSGATGSGKTTQLPKLCLAAGRGLNAMIGHTQPRRLAARTVAARIAEELTVPLGGVVGFQVRFEDRTTRKSRIKLMTDGILLNAIRHDRYLEAFDTIILDEAHERSINIDFLLGYLKKILPRRPDLRVIITSATVDTNVFSRYFGDAPVINVEGRMHPVTIEYAPPGEGQTLTDAVVSACNGLAARSDTSGDIRDMLVFLPGEQSIHDVRAALNGGGPSGYEVLPLYARLKLHQQQRVFMPGPKPRIVLATNIAETSLTVPRIRFVVDSGLARVKRYSARHRIDTLQIEPIAMANADQRAGRCGRVAPGTCVRLYTEDDYRTRGPHTDPEILRTNLAGVVLRVRTLGFGALDTFPFIDPPEQKFINDAERLLHVLGALDDKSRLTRDGRVMARLPVDPRLARILLEGHKRRCLGECLVLAAVMSAGDPRETIEHKDDSRRELRREMSDCRSDFTTLLTIWGLFSSARRDGGGALRRLCQSRGLAEHRLREWEEVHGQLVAITESLGWKRGPIRASYARLHKALLTGFVDYIATHEGRGAYRGMHGVRARLFPGSDVAGKPPTWVMAAEHVSTERNYLRTVARIEPHWVEEVAPHILKRQTGEPEWDARRGFVAARETTSAFGLVLSADRSVDFGPVDPVRAREIFIRQALAEGDPGADLPFMRWNAAQRARILEWEARRRSRDLYIGDRALAGFYSRQLPKDVRDRASLAKWCAIEGNEHRLHIDWQELITHDVSASIRKDYPDEFEGAGQALKLSYRYAPGEDDDGLTLRLPAVLIDSVQPERLEWLVPGYLEAKVLALLRSLPKEHRRPLVPLPDTAALLIPPLLQRFGAGRLVTAIAELLSGQFERPIPEAAFDASRLPEHLVLRTELIGPGGEILAGGRDFSKLRLDYGGDQSPLRPPRGSGRGIDGQHTSWDFGDLPDYTDVDRFGTTLRLYPAVSTAGRGVRLDLLPPGPSAAETHRLGVRRLLVLAQPQQAALLRARARDDRSLLLGYHGIGSTDEFVEDILAAAAEATYAFDASCRRAEDFHSIVDLGRDRYVEHGERVIQNATDILAVARDVRKRLDRLESAAASAAEDMSLQLERLVFPGFLAATPPLWLAQLPRYLRAMQVRCESLRYRNDRDRRDQALIELAQARWLQYRSTLPAGWPLPPAVERYRWLTEELRVSLFAQGLGTSTPVSGKRLERFWMESVR